MSVPFRYKDKNQPLLLSELAVVVGAHNLMSHEASQRQYSIEFAVVHGQFFKDKLTHDIMLVELSTRIKFSEKIRPICVDDKVFRPGTLCYVTGWGTTNADVVSTYIHYILSFCVFTRVFATATCPSVCPSVRPSVACRYCA